jgi:hypothetical protein
MSDYTSSTTPALLDFFGPSYLNVTKSAYLISSIVVTASSFSSPISAILISLSAIYSARSSMSAVSQSSTRSSLSSSFASFVSTTFFSCLTTSLISTSFCVPSSF